MRRRYATWRWLALVALAVGAGRAADVHVHDFGAVADGQTDCTAAFQQAMDACAASGGGVVTVPAGQYRFTGNLQVPLSVTLEGTWRIPPTVDRYHATADPDSPPVLSGSVLLPTAGAGDPDGEAFLTLATNATVKGLTIFYPEQTRTNPPVAYPWTIRSGGADNCSVVDCLLVNPYQAVDFGTRTSGRHYVRNLYGQPLRRGLYVDLCFDIGRIENVHFWPFWEPDGSSPVRQYMREEAEAFIFGRCDWEYVVNCFAIEYAVGFRFIATPEPPNPGLGGGGNVLLTQSGADLCPVAVQVDETQGHSGVSFSNSQIFGDIVVADTNHGPIKFDGCGIFGGIEGARTPGMADIGGWGRVSFSDCHIFAIHAGNEAEALIRVRQGRISIIGCVFINHVGTAIDPVPIILEPDVVTAIIVGNEFYGPMRLVNRARGRVEVANNVEETASDPYPETDPPQD